MKTFKYLIAFALLITSSLVTTKADVAIYNPTATAIASVLQKPLTIQQIQFSNAATNSVTVTLTDSPTNTTTFTVGAYTNNVLSVGNVITTFTNITGIVESSTNLTLTSTLTPVSAVTNNYRTLLIQLIPASSTVTFTPPNGMPAGFGLAASTTATNVTATISYTSPK